MLEVRPDELARIERIALRTLGYQLDHVRSLAVQEVPHEVGDRGVTEWFERDRQVVEPAAAPGRTAVEKLRARKHHHEHRCLSPRLHHELGEIQQAVARPVQVLEDDDQRRVTCGRLEGRAPRRKEQVLVDAFGPGLADGGRQQLRFAFGVHDAETAEPRPDRLTHLRGRCLFAGAGQREQHLAHRPVRELLAIRQALCSGHDRVRRQGWQPVQELLDQARLACARGRNHADHRRSPLAYGATRDQLQLQKIVLAADKRQSHAGLRPLPARADHLASGNRDGLPLRHDLDLIAELKRVDRGAHRAVADQDRPRLGGLLQPSGDIGRVTSDQKVAGGLVAAGHDLAGADAEPDRKAPVEPLVAADPVAHGERRGDRAVGIVSVRRRKAENRHHRVADELLDRAAVLRDRFARNGVVQRQQAAHLLGVELLAERGGAGHVREQHGHDAPFLGRDRHSRR